LFAEIPGLTGDSASARWLVATNNINSAIAMALGKRSEGLHERRTEDEFTILGSPGRRQRKT
jgi:hypothetical protein